MAVHLICTIGAIDDTIGDIVLQDASLVIAAKMAPQAFAISRFQGKFTDNMGYSVVIISKQILHFHVRNAGE